MDRNLDKTTLSDSDLEDFLAKTVGGMLPDEDAAQKLWETPVSPASSDAWFLMGTESLGTDAHSHSQSSLDPQTPPADPGLIDPEPVPAPVEIPASFERDHAPASTDASAPSGRDHAPAPTDAPIPSGQDYMPGSRRRSSVRSKVIRVIFTLAATAACLMIILYFHMRLSGPVPDSGILSGLLENLREFGSPDASTENSEDDNADGTDPADGGPVTDDAAEQTDPERAYESEEDPDADSYNNSRDPSGEDEILSDDQDDHDRDNDSDDDKDPDDDNDSDEDIETPDVDDKKEAEEEASEEGEENDSSGEDEQSSDTEDRQDSDQEEGSENDGWSDREDSTENEDDASYDDSDEDDSDSDRDQDSDREEDDDRDSDGDEEEDE